MVGAAIANVIAMFLYNSIRFTFLWAKIGLMPFSLNNLYILVFGSAIITAVYLIPSFSNIYIDGLLRSILFAGLYGCFIIRFNLSGEVSFLWSKWSKKILHK
jgi:hypothetical protein